LEADTLICRQFGYHVVYVNHELKGTTVAVDKLGAGLAGIRIAVVPGDSP
jgi:hypothetical protein